MTTFHASRRLPFETARLALARVRLDTADDLEAVAARATRICAEALGVERVGIWLFGDDGVLQCMTTYVRSTQRHEHNGILLASTFPTYFAALESRRVIAADDARDHPLTRELTASYLEPNGIASMLDAPVFRSGRLFGVLCHEHLGTTRQWTPGEIAFASAVAEVVALVFEQAERARVEAELRETTARAREMDRLLEVRRLALGVAHDFNNVLTSALGLCEAIESPVPGETPAQLHAEMREVLEVGRKLAAQLMHFAAPRSEDATATTTAALAALRATEPVLRMLLRPRALLDLATSGEEISVALRPLEFEQLVLNLCINARDAIVERGTVTVRARGGEQLALEISDDGVGMSDEIKQHLFEPYFTTKPTGTGMGLPLVLELVQRVGGSLEVDSGQGRGTTMRVRLPRGG